MANRRVSLVRRIRGDGRWKYVQPVVSDKGRVSPDMVKILGGTTRVIGGVWHLVWHEGTKKMRRAIGPSLTAAVAAQYRQQQKLAALDAGLKMVEDLPIRRKLKDAVADFLHDLELRDRQDETVQAYRLVLEPFADCCGKTYLDQLDRKDVLQYLKSLRDNGLGARTIFNRFINLQTFLKANGLKLTNKRDTPRYVDAEPEVYTVAELQRFFTACDPGQHLLFEFLLKTGCRMQEVMYASWSDLDFDHLTFRVSAKPSRGFRPKSWEEREIPLEPRLARALDEHKRRSRNTALVFPTKGGKPNSKMLQTLKRIARRGGLNCGQCGSCLTTKAAECERWFLHKFRATFATMQLQAGVDLRTVQSWLGHKDLESTMRYLKPARGKDAQEKLRRTFAGIQLEAEPASAVPAS